METKNMDGKNQISTGVKRYQLIRVCIKITVTTNNSVKKVEIIHDYHSGGIIYNINSQRVEGVYGIALLTW